MRSGEEKLDLVGVTEGHLDELAFGNHAVTDTDELLTDLETFGDTDHHVVDESPVETVHGTEARLVAGTGECDDVTLYIDGDGRVNLLAQLTERSFNLHHVTVEELYAHAGRKVYRKFSNS